MSAVRQDAWSAEDDLILAEVTLRHIREATNWPPLRKWRKNRPDIGGLWISLEQAFARNMRMLSAWRNLSVKREVIIKQPSVSGPQVAGRSGTGARCL